MVLAEVGCVPAAAAPGGESGVEDRHAELS
jgi:hypothetical protein